MVLLCRDGLQAVLHNLKPDVYTNYRLIEEGKNEKPYRKQLF